MNAKSAPVVLQRHWQVDSKHRILVRGGLAFGAYLLLERIIPGIAHAKKRKPREQTAIEDEYEQQLERYQRQYQRRQTIAQLSLEQAHEEYEQVLRE